MVTPVTTSPTTVAIPVAVVPFRFVVPSGFWGALKVTVGGLVAL
jgi:hypothetical protein